MTRKVGIVAKSFIDWSGGIDFIVYIANGLALSPDYDLSLLIPDSADPTHTNVNSVSELKTLQGNLSEKWKSRIKKPDAKYKEEEIKDLSSALNKQVKIVYYPNSPRDFINWIKKLKIEVVVPTTLPYGTSFPIPWVGYIWDFQHKYYPKYFSKHEQSERDKIFQETLTQAPAIIVNSLQTREDIRKFYPKFSDFEKIVALPFTPSPMSSWLDIKYKPIKKKYKLPDRYIMVANQFWVHKDHLTAIEAMKILVKDIKYQDVHLVCTGKMEEPRIEGYIDKVRTIASSKDIAKNIHFLGYLPKEDQLSIMRNAACIVQPTLYEGGPGGGVAYNAVALGVPLIASDIPVNKEIVGKNVALFKTGSASDLARNIKIMLNKPLKPISNSELINMGVENLKKLNMSLSEGVEKAVSNFRKGGM